MQMKNIKANKTGRHARIYGLILNVSWRDYRIFKRKSNNHLGAIQIVA